MKKDDTRENGRVMATAGHDYKGWLFIAPVEAGDDGKEGAE